MFHEKEFGKNIKRIREAMSMSNYDFAIAVDIDYSYLSNIECGRTIPTVKRVIAILNELNLTYEECIHSDFSKVKEFYHNNIRNKMNLLTEEDLNFLLQLIEILKMSWKETEHVL